MSGARSAEQDAELAQQLLDNPLFLDVIAELDSDAVRTWRAGSNPEQREHAWHGMHALQAMMHRIKGRIEAKKLAGRRTRT